MSDGFQERIDAGIEFSGSSHYWVDGESFHFQKSGKSFTCRLFTFCVALSSNIDFSAYDGRHENSVHVFHYPGGSGVAIEK